ncbi:MAG: glycosyltransferase, partial [Rhodothermales bacterium]|nr:glycosyltransferase [Rhodothermales bacterium]
MTPTGVRRRVLVLAYYFPPLGLSGVQRIARFVKYLPDHGWDPVVVTPEPGGYFAFDPELLSDLEDRGIPIHRTRSLDPTRAFTPGAEVSLPGEQRRRRLSSLSQWLFVPDNKVGWMPFANTKAAELLGGGDFSAILSTAPPYSSHVAAGRLARRFRLPLVLDYRDDWLDNPRHEYPTWFHRRLHAGLEKRAAQRASALVTINDVIAKRLRERLKADVTVIPQGFDPDDYRPSEDRGDDGPAERQDDAAATPEHPPPDQIAFIYTGVFYDRQSPESFLRG